MRPLFAASTLMLLSACSTLPNPDPNQAWVDLTPVDETSLHAVQVDERDWADTRYFEVAPGSHELTVRYQFPVTPSNIGPVNEPLWRLPLGPQFAGEMKSDLADLRNTGKTTGASTAAWFLQQFVGETPWAHIDIAGNALATLPGAEEHYRAKLQLVILIHHQHLLLCQQQMPRDHHHLLGGITKDLRLDKTAEA